EPRVLFDPRHPLAHDGVEIRSSSTRWRSTRDHAEDVPGAVGVLDVGRTARVAATRRFEHRPDVDAVVERVPGHARHRGLKVPLDAEADVVAAVEVVVADADDPRFSAGGDDLGLATVDD